MIRTVGIMIAEKMYKGHYAYIGYNETKGDQSKTSHNSSLI